MKKIILSAMFSMVAWMGANAMSFSRAQAEALYLTDKMAYELNLNDQQYNDAYEINLDYFLRIDSPSDLYGSYYDYRVHDLRCILHDWQYNLFIAADYFLRPLVWRATGGWYFPIYSYYSRDYFYYSHPNVWVSYRGGHSHYYHHAGFYTHRRPVWNGGFRGHDMHRPAVGHGGAGHHGGYRPGAGGHRPGGNGYHVDFGGHRGGSNSGNHGGSNHGGSNHGGVNPGGSHSGGHSGNVNPGSGRSHSGGVNPGGNHSGSHSGMGSHSGSRGNSFDRSSSRAGGSHVGGASRGSSSYGGSRGGSSVGGSRGGHSGGASRGGRQ